LSKEKRLYFNTLVTEFKKTNASHESVEAIFDFVYLLEKSNASYDETLLLVESYEILGHIHKAFELYKAVDIQPFSKKQAQKYHTKLAALKKKTLLPSPFTYRDLRPARVQKEVKKLTEEDFSITYEDNKQKIEINKNIDSIVILNKYLPTFEVTILNATSNLQLIIDYLFWLGNCKDEIIKHYNRYAIEDKLSHVDEKWFDGLDVWDVEIEITDDSIFGTITIIDYYNNNYGFHLETIDHSVYSIEYDPILR
jgi:hypothetical protein